MTASSSQAIRDEPGDCFRGVPAAGSDEPEEEEHREEEHRSRANQDPLPDTHGFKGTDSSTRCSQRRMIVLWEG